MRPFTSIIERLLGRASFFVTLMLPILLFYHYWQFIYGYIFCQFQKVNNSAKAYLVKMYQLVLSSVHEYLLDCNDDDTIVL